jgi:hypothetical protein
VLRARMRGAGGATAVRLAVRGTTRLCASRSERYRSEHAMWGNGDFVCSLAQCSAMQPRRS